MQSFGNERGAKAIFGTSFVFMMNESGHGFVIETIILRDRGIIRRMHQTHIDWCRWVAMMNQAFTFFRQKDESSREASHWFQNTLKVMDLGNDDVRDYSRTQYHNQLFVLIFYDSWSAASYHHSVFNWKDIKVIVSCLWLFVKYDHGFVELEHRWQV